MAKKANNDYENIELRHSAQMEDTDYKFEQLFPEQSKSFRTEPFSNEVLKFIINDTAEPIIRGIDHKISPFVQATCVKVFKRVISLTISEYGRWFYFHIKANKFNSVSFLAEYEESIDDKYSKKKVLIAEKIIDYRQGNFLTAQMIIDFFLETFPNRIKLFTKEIDVEKKLKSENDRLKIEKKRSEIIDLIQKNNARSEESFLEEFVNLLIEMIAFGHYVNTPRKERIFFDD